MKLRRLAAGVLGVLIGVGAVVALRAATMATHQQVDPDTRLELVLSARRHGGERSQTLDEMVNAAVLACRLRVDTDLDGPMRAQGDGRYQGILRPALDASNRTELRGCLEDWVVDHLQVDVIEMVEHR